MKKLLYAVIGSPIGHSRSPMIYNYLFGKYGINAEYGTFEVKLNELETFLKNTKLLGLNLTMPLKEKATELVTPVGDAYIMKSVNTIDMKTKKGYTTDGQGLVLSLTYNGVNVKDRNVVVMGAGGAAKSVCLALKNAGAKVIVLNRTAQKANALGEQLSIKAGGLERMSEFAPTCEVFINCTKLGMDGGGELPFCIDALNKKAFVYDIVYEPKETALLKFAKKRGQKYCNGIDMLICQALLAFEIYTGIKTSKQDRDELLKRM